MYGTIPWAAPEVLRQEKARTESDIWYDFNNITLLATILLAIYIANTHVCRSVAATVVEMYTGKSPYMHKDRMPVHQILMKVGNGSLNPMKTPSLQESLKKGLVPEDLEILLNDCFKL